MFRALYRPSSGTSTVLAATGLPTLAETARGAVWVLNLKRNTIVCTNTGSENKKEIPEWRESCHLCKIAGLPSRQIVPSFAARMSGGFAYVEAPGGESGNY